MMMTGFGTPGTQDFVYFTHLVSEGGRVPDWHAQLKVDETSIVGSSDVEVQVLGYDSARIELRLLFRNRDDYYRLQEMMGHKQSLVLVAQQTRFRGRLFHWRGHHYEEFENALLVGLVPQFRVGATLATATFLRSVSGMGGMTS